MDVLLHGLQAIGKKRKWSNLVTRMGNAVGNSTRVQTPEQFADIVPGSNSGSSIEEEAVSPVGDARGSATSEEERPKFMLDSSRASVKLGRSKGQGGPPLSETTDSSTSSVIINSMDDSLLQHGRNSLGAKVVAEEQRAQEQEEGDGHTDNGKGGDGAVVSMERCCGEIEANEPFSKPPGDV